MRADGEESVEERLSSLELCLEYLLDSLPRGCLRRDEYETAVKFLDPDRFDRIERDGKP